MNALRPTVERPWDGNGVPFYENGVIVGKVVVYGEWSCPAKAIYENPETIWIDLGWDNKPLIIEDENGNPVS